MCVCVCEHTPTLCDAHKYTHTRAPSDRADAFTHGKKKNTTRLRSVHAQPGSDAQPGDGAKILCRCHGDTASFSWRGEAERLPGGTGENRAAAAAVPKTSHPVVPASHFLFCFRPLTLISCAGAKASVVICLISLNNSPPSSSSASSLLLIHKSHPSVLWRGPSLAGGPGSTGLRLQRQHQKMEGAARHHPPC